MGPFILAIRGGLGSRFSSLMIRLLSAVCQKICIRRIRQMVCCFGAGYGNNRLHGHDLVLCLGHIHLHLQFQMVPMNKSGAVSALEE